jgi:UDP-N-acetyl-D-mannosaminuronate dehydrogenase
MDQSILHINPSASPLINQKSTSVSAATENKSESGLSQIAIVGLGYVGLPLSLQFGRSGVEVLGLDIDPAKVDALNGGTQLHRAYRIMDLLKQRGAEVAYYDPHVPVIRPTREHPQWSGLKSLPWDRSVIAGFDAVVVATAHARVNYQELADWAQCIIALGTSWQPCKPLQGEFGKRD